MLQVLPLDTAPGSPPNPLLPNPLLDGVLEIWLAASLQAHAFVPAAHWRAQVRNMREHYLPLSETLVYCDDATGRPLGFASLVDDVLAGLFVTPDAQGQGVGRRLLELCLRMHPELSLKVYARNTRAVRFYERHGFVRCGVGVEAQTGCVEYSMRHVPAAGGAGVLPV